MPDTPRDADAFTGDALRAWSTTHPVVRDVVGALPQRVEGAHTTDGLFVDVTPAPAIEVNGTTRVSALRIVSVVAGDARLVGQVQVTERDSGGGLLRALHTFVHDADYVGAQEARDVDAWWVLVLDAHYERGGAPVDLPDARW